MSPSGNFWFYSWLIFVYFVCYVYLQFLPSYRSCRPEGFWKKGVLENLTKFTGKRLCQSLFFNKVADLMPATLLKKRLWHRCFAVNFAKFLRTLFLTEHLRGLLLCWLFKKPAIRFLTGRFRGFFQRFWRIFSLING